MGEVCQEYKCRDNIILQLVILRAGVARDVRSAALTALCHKAAACITLLICVSRVPSLYSNTSLTILGLSLTRQHWWPVIENRTVIPRP